MDTTVTVDRLQASPHGAEFDELVRRHPRGLAQQTPTWAHIVSAIDRDEPYLVTVREEGRVIGGVIVHEYPHKLGSILFSDPHAGSLGSIVTDPDLKSGERKGVVERLVDELSRLAEEKNALTLTLTSNPFLEHLPLSPDHRPDFVLQDRVHYVELDAYFDENDRVVLPDYNRRSNLSRNLRKGRESSLRVEERDDPSALAEWYEVHRTHMAEVGGRPIPESLFREAHDRAVPDRAAFLYVVDENESIVGGGFFVFDDRVVDILMMSSTRSALERGANYLLTDEALRWARRRRFELFNWQASNPPTGGIVRFKEQWGSETARFQYLTWVTSDLDPLFEAGLDRMRQAYRWHYVLPFGAFENPDRSRFSKTDSEVFFPTS